MLSTFGLLFLITLLFMVALPIVLALRFAFKRKESVSLTEYERAVKLTEQDII